MQKSLRTQFNDLMYYEVFFYRRQHSRRETLATH